jgi:methionine-rich copper-binding protein CopC
MTEERIIAYLLGELPEEQSEQFEEECFAQERWPAQISMGEEDLIDAYLRNELSQEQRQRFEQHYLTTEARQERVSMAAALLRRLDECQPAAQTTVTIEPAQPGWAERLRAFWDSQNWALRTAMSLGVTVVLATTLWFTLLRAPSPGTYDEMTLAHSVNNRAEGVRADKVKLPLKSDALKISLTLPERLPPAAGYRVELENEDGKTRNLDIAGYDAKSVSVLIPAYKLERGLYALNLFAINADGAESAVNGNYFFTVE